MMFHSKSPIYKKFLLHIMDKLGHPQNENSKDHVAECESYMCITCKFRKIHLCQILPKLLSYKTT